jgi:hypothetical protein
MAADSLAALNSDGAPRHLVVDALNLLGASFLGDFLAAFDPATDLELWSKGRDTLGRAGIGTPREGYARGARSPSARAFGDRHGFSKDKT